MLKEYSDFTKAISINLNSFETRFQTNLVDPPQISLTL